jgi:hypothetical protein
MMLLEAEPQAGKAAIASFGQTLRAYWDHEMARPVPSHLLELAATADEVLAKSVTRSVPEGRANTCGCE